MTSQYVCVWLYDNNHTFEEKKIDNRKRRNPAQLFGRIFFEIEFFLSITIEKSPILFYIHAMIDVKKIISKKKNLNSN